MLKNIFYRKTDKNCEFWFEFEEQILHHSTSGEFGTVKQIPEDALEMPLRTRETFTAPFWVADWRASITMSLIR